MSPIGALQNPKFLAYLSLFFAAVSTNHSLGDVVYKKAAKMAINVEPRGLESHSDAYRNPSIVVEEVVQKRGTTICSPQSPKRSRAALRISSGPSPSEV